MRWRAAFLAATVLAGCQGAPEPLDYPVRARLHDEIRFTPSGEPRPLFLGDSARAGICFRVPREVDTSQWTAHLTLAGVRDPANDAPPAARMDETLCFDGILPPGVPAGGPHPLCVRGTDLYDDSALALPCTPVFIQPDDAEFRRLEQAMLQDLRDPDSRELEELLARLATASETARSSSYPLLAVQARLIAVYFARRASRPDSPVAARLLEDLPEWLDHPAAAHRGAQAAYERAQIALATDSDPALAWEPLRQAEELFVSVAHQQRYAVAMAQAGLLARAGAPREAARRLRAALQDCEGAFCHPAMLPHVEGQLAWVVQQDPEASPQALREAAEAAVRAVSRLDAEREPIERANQLLNAAQVGLRIGRDPHESLAQARDAVRATDGKRADEVRAWSDLIEGLWHLDRGHFESALRTCAGRTSDPSARLSAWAASCTGQAHRALGDARAARDAFELALIRHRFAAPTGSGFGPPLGPGQRADDFARAARIAVETGRFEDAWGLLTELDDLADAEAQRRRCREGALEPDVARRWQEIDAEIAELLPQLPNLEEVAAGSRQRQAQRLARGVKQRLSDLWRERPGCSPRSAKAAGSADLRAVALPDEILLLVRDQAGRVELVRRSPIARDRLRTILLEATAALDAPSPETDPKWRMRLEPLAQALWPPKQLEGHLSYALHGILQATPLAALPRPGSETGWLADVATISVVTSAGREGLSAPSGTDGTLFVVDPTRDLEGAAQLTAFYRDTHPTATLLDGERATRDAVRAAWRRASSIHLDAHGRYEPAFPELSGVELSDGTLTFIELGEISAGHRLVNLSGCKTGAWPVTAGSGRYGLAGLVARLGASWAIGTRADLDDEVARRFNRRLYDRLAAGSNIAEAYDSALGELRSHFEAARWASLLLVRSTRNPPEGGQIASASTPYLLEEPRSITTAAREKGTDG